MAKSYLIDGLAWLVILSWIGFSVFFWNDGNPDMFQRFGALGIVSGVIYYAIFPPPVVHPIGMIEAQSWRDKTVIEIVNGTVSANMNVSILAASLQLLMEGEGKTASQSIVALAKPAKQLTEAGRSYPDPVNRDIEIEMIASDITAADKNAARVERIRFITQAALVVIGTLQNGFGSLIVSAG